MDKLTKKSKELGTDKKFHNNSSIYLGLLVGFFSSGFIFNFGSHLVKKPQQLAEPVRINVIDSCNPDSSDAIGMSEHEEKSVLGFTIFEHTREWDLSKVC